MPVTGVGRQCGRGSDSPGSGSAEARKYHKGSPHGRRDGLPKCGQGLSPSEGEELGLGHKINLVDWADILMRERKGVDGQDGEDMGVTTGLVSPVLFAIFAREASDGWKCGWTRLSPSSSAGDSDADDYDKKRKELVGRAETATGRWRGALR